MTEETKNRIEAEATEYAGNYYNRAHFPANWSNRWAGYKSGATAEYLRSEQVIAELKETALGKSAKWYSDLLAEKDKEIAELKTIQDFFGGNNKLQRQEQVINGLVEALQEAQAIAREYNNPSVMKCISNHLTSYYNSIKPNNTESNE